MKNIFIIHGSNGYPEENWFPWLKEKLEGIKDVKVKVPQFPVPPSESGKHIYDKWLKKLEEYRKDINEETIFVTHSRGGVFIMHALVDLNIPRIGGLFMVAPWIQYRWYNSPNSILDSFHFNPIDWATLKNIATHIEIFQSTNDIIPVEEGIGIAAMLKAHFEIVENAGHFNVKAGYTSFPLLLERVTKFINESGKHKKS